MHPAITQTNYAEMATGAKDIFVAAYGQSGRHCLNIFPDFAHQLCVHIKWSQVETTTDYIF